MSLGLSDASLEKLLAKLDKPAAKFMRFYPGESEDRQPVHTVYGGAQLYKAETTSKIGQLGLKFVKTHAPDALTFARMMGESDDPALTQVIYDRVLKKLETCAVEDFRIDFEDGFGIRPDAEEDETAVAAAREFARAVAGGTAPPFCGIRIKTFSEELKHRAARTLNLFLSTLLGETNGKVPENFVITLPKVLYAEQVAVFVELLEDFEDHFGLAPRSLKMEIMIEQTQAIFDHKGRVTLPALIKETKGRCRGAHFGTYDYTASCDVTAAEQRMDHPHCTLALQVMKNCLASTGIWLSDGATSIMPVAPHKEPKTKGEITANQKAISHAWQMSYRHINHSLMLGFYQGWDLHPAQLPVRYAACYGFFLRNLTDASARLKNFIDKAAQATLVGDVFDDAATGQGLLNYFIRAEACGAITEAEVTATGISLAELRGKSFKKILENRKAH